MRFCLEKEDVIAVLSGMSTLAQVLDNTATANESKPLTGEEKKALAEAMRLYRESAPIKQSEIGKYKGLMYHGVPVSAILQAYSIAEAEHRDFHQGLEKQTVVTADGTDVTELVEKALAWLTENSF